MLPQATTTADQVVYAVASSSVSIFNATIPLWIDVGGILLAFFCALAIMFAVIDAARSP